ncbi:MAG: folylpolyglutamate synthase/dihydrofolate synthase family protein [Synergistes sp.]|nr:folylpolyglutamate synthase/dihydrofolate synthase family protein [Synergistes sp.]
MYKTNFGEVQRRIEKLSSPTITAGLGRVASILYACGMPQDKFASVHIAGTNGKGSVAATLYSILRKSGYRCVLNTSPHLVDFSERLEIDGDRVSDRIWLNAVDKISDIVSTSNYLSRNRPNFFEILTVASIMITADEKPDIAIFETGMGGRYDATNILGNVVLSIITSIGMDHTEYLGDTLEKIAAEKFAVMRPDAPAVFAGNKIINEQFTEAAALHSTKHHIFSEECKITAAEYSLRGTKFTIKTPQTSYTLKTPLVGTFQTENVGLAVLASEILSEKFTKITRESINTGVAATCWQGRMEIISEELPIIVDGGHNEHAMERITETVESIFGNKKISIVIAMMRDKEVFNSLNILKKLNARLYCTEVPDNPRTLKADELLKIASDAGLDAERSYKSPIDALNASVSDRTPVLCCGSLYLVGWIKEHKDELQWLQD